MRGHFIISIRCFEVIIGEGSASVETSEIKEECEELRVNEYVLFWNIPWDLPCHNLVLYLVNEDHNQFWDVQTQDTAVKSVGCFIGIRETTLHLRNLKVYIQQQSVAPKEVLWDDRLYLAV